MIFGVYEHGISVELNARVCASPAGRLHPSTPHPPIYIGGGGVGCEGLCGGRIKTESNFVVGIVLDTFNIYQL